jgi:aerobic carbon-monoxide dehydrogenase medium subunit
MKPAAFSYFRPVSIDDALRQLAAGGAEAKLIAGGQSLGPMMNMRLARPAQLVDLNDLTELAYVREAGDWLRIGSLTRHYQLAESPLVRRHCPLLAQAAQTIGHYAIRQRGTLGGSIAHADPAAQLPLVALTLGARLHVRSATRSGTLDAADFFVSAMTTTLAPDELIEYIEFPKAKAGEAAAYRLFNRRHGDYAIIAAATSVSVAGGKVDALRIGLGGATPVPQSLRALAQSACGRRPDEAWVRDVARGAADQLEVEEDQRMSIEYRRELAQTVVARALNHALAQLKAA